MVHSDWSDPFDCISWYHMRILSLILKNLSRSGTIGQDEVELVTCTFFSVVFKANEWTHHSIFFTNNCSKGKDKMLGAFLIDAYWFWKSDRWKDDDSSDPLGNSRVKKLFDSLQLDNLLFAEAEQRDVHKALRKSELAAQLYQPLCYLCKLLTGSQPSLNWV